MTAYADFYRHSINQPESFWAEQSKAIDWQLAPQVICDHSQPPFAK